MTDTLGIVFHGITLAALTAVLWYSIRNGRGITHMAAQQVEGATATVALTESISRLARQQAEVELDGAIDRELLTGKRDAELGAIRDRVRNLLSRPSEAVLHRAYGDAYEQEIGTRIDGRRR